MERNKLLANLKPVNKVKMRESAKKYNKAVMAHRAKFRLAQAASEEYVRKQVLTS